MHLQASRNYRFEKIPDRDKRLGYKTYFILLFNHLLSAPIFLEFRSQEKAQLSEIEREFLVGMRDFG
jgi:hypothetical protein